MFSSKKFIVSGLTFKPLIHFEFIFVYGVRKCSNFILLHVAVQFSQNHLLKRLCFSLESSDRQLVTQLSETLGLANLARAPPGHLLVPRIPRDRGMALCIIYRVHSFLHWLFMGHLLVTEDVSRKQTHNSSALMKFQSRRQRSAIRTQTRKIVGMLHGEMVASAMKGKKPGEG